jgi:hypothetical protein
MNEHARPDMGTLLDLLDEALAVARKLYEAGELGAVSSRIQLPEGMRARASVPQEPESPRVQEPAQPKRRRSKRPPREELAELCTTCTRREIAEHYGVNVGTVWYWEDQYDLRAQPGKVGVRRNSKSWNAPPPPEERRAPAGAESPRVHSAPRGRPSADRLSRADEKRVPPAPTRGNQDEKRERLGSDVQAFLNRGGQVAQLPGPGEGARGAPPVGHGRESF